MLTGRNLNLPQVIAVARCKAKVSISSCAIKRMNASRAVVEKVVKEGRIVYGINTGFGKNATVTIPSDQLIKLQENILVSHAVGTGKPLPEDAVRALMLMTLNKFATGYSGISPRIAVTLAEMLNKGVLPYIPEKGSLGASGDLAPLSHLGLLMTGHPSSEAIRVSASGEITKINGVIALRQAGIKPIKLLYKDGLAMINGTTFMTGLLSLALYDSMVLADSADRIAAMTMEALKSTTQPFDKQIHAARPHPGQIKSAANIRKAVRGTEMMIHNTVQDAYSIRCVPQAHGAARDVIEHVQEILEREINSGTDNPLVFEKTGQILSGGNFQGTPLALAADNLTSALTVLGNISERRTYRLLDAKLNNGLPMFLTPEPGLNNGLMMYQYSAAALALENAGMPRASALSLPTCAGQEDYVSNGANAVRNCATVAENVFNILGIEMIAAAQALDLRGGADSAGKITRITHQMVRKYIPYLSRDRIAAFILIRDAVALLKRRELFNKTI